MAKKSVPVIFHVNAFTDKPFSGNPAAVCILAKPVSVDWMQNVAKEMNLSETAFLHHGKGDYNLRWFTPVTEVDLCGHATLASAHILWEQGYVNPKNSVRFRTRSGVITVWNHGRWIEMDFPAVPVSPSKSPKGLFESLGANLAVKYVGRNRFDYLLEVKSEKIVRQIQPDFNLLKKIKLPRGLIVTAKSNSAKYDFASRFFAPAAGIDEDPVTGSAHCALGPYWSEKSGKSNLTGYQVSSRGGIVHVKVNGNRVMLGGQAVTIAQGELL